MNTIDPTTSCANLTPISFLNATLDNYSPSSFDVITGVVICSIVVILMVFMGMFYAKRSRDSKLAAEAIVPVMTKSEEALREYYPNVHTDADVRRY